MYTWTTTDDGSIRVSDDGGPAFTPTLRDPKLCANVEHGIARFGMPFRLKGETFGVDWRWLIAMAFRESAFDPRAFRVEKRADGTPIISPGGRPLTGVGLFQLTSPEIKGAYSDEQLFEPGLNTIIACRHIANLMRRAECQGLDGKADFVRVSAAFNAGSVRPPRPGFENKWQFHSARGHIDAEVAALNYTSLRGIAERELAEGNVVAHTFDLVDMARTDDEDARRSYPTESES